MATFNGTQAADTISGTNEDDIITGLGGADVINGAAGNDVITGGAGADDILGGAGNDTIIVDAAAELAAGEDIDGGDDDDTLAVDLLDADDLSSGTGAATISGVAITGTFQNVEYVQVSNASDFMLDLTSGEDQVFAFDLSLDSNDFGATGATDVDGATYTAATDVIDADGVAFDEDEGVVINGTTYADGDEYTTAAGGTVAIAFDGANNVWTFHYTATPQAVIEMGETVEDEVLDVQATDTNGNVITIAVSLDSTVDDTVDLSATGEDVDTATRVIADNDNASTITDGEGNDTIIGGTLADDITLQSDANNTVWAGATDAGNDTVTVTGHGENIIGAGAGGDLLDIDGDGNNTLFGGAGADTFDIAGDGDNTAWGGASDDADTFTVTGEGNNTLGGGLGVDVFNVGGTGDNIIFAGADDDNDDINITGTGNNTVFGGQGEDGDGANDIDVTGTGNNTIYNGNGDDFVDFSAAATGDNVAYGGAGDDTFTFAVGATGTVIFETGHGSDSVTGLELDGVVEVDLSAFGFADADDVLNSMTDGANGVDLFITAGQVITLENDAGDLTLADLQAADPADWLIL